MKPDPERTLKSQQSRDKNSVKVAELQEAEPAAGFN